MSVADKVLSALRLSMVLDERTITMGKSLNRLEAKFDAFSVDHEKRLARIEAVIEIVRPDGGVMRIAPPQK